MVETLSWMHLLLVSLFSFSHSTYALIHALRDDLLNKLITTTSLLQHLLFREPNKGNDHHQNVSCPWRQLALRLQCTSMRAEIGWWPNCSVLRSKPWFWSLTFGPQLHFLTSASWGFRVPVPLVHQLLGAHRGCCANYASHRAFLSALRF